MKILTLLALILMFCSVDNESHALLKVNITQGNSAKIPVAIKICNGSNNHLWHEISNIVKENFSHSGIIEIINDKHVSTACDSFASVDSLDFNKSAKSVALLTLYTEHNGGNIEVRFRLFDTLMKTQLVGKVFTAKTEDHRRIAHMISDMIYNKLTGDSGYFDTKILYVSESNGKKRIAVMDQDGENHSFITSGDHLTITPRFSPDNSKVIYTSYINNQAKVYYRDLTADNEKMIGNFSGVISAPRFSPDGRSVILARSINDVTDIYSIDLKDDKRRKLTLRSSINTSPSYSPDQSKIAFNSDRSGRPQIYVMNTDGSNQKKISADVGSYMSPVWSPRGDLIAFTKIYNKRFYIGVMRPNGTGERILTSGYLVEGASWAPNGRIIVFTKENPPTSGKKNKAYKGSSSIHTIDIMGFNERVIHTKHNASQPAWSSLLK